MARLESIAVGGYFPTPPHVVQMISAMLDYNGASAVVDPCAGEGAAVFSLLPSRVCEVYTCEMERSRHAALVARAKASGSWRAENHALHGDAFLVDVRAARGLYGGGAHVLYLNPPYDLDPVHARLEERFLERFTDVLRSDGLLVFVVPFYALKASAETLALHYDVSVGGGCWRFPDPDFDVYRQVVLFARKVEGRLEPSTYVRAQVLAWSESADDMPVLGTAEPRSVTIFGESYSSSMTWQIQQVDVEELVAKSSPWKTRARPGAVAAPVPHILSELPVQDLSFRSYPLATSPRPAHIAAGIASGLFNGRRVSGNGPDLLVKGVFDREFKTVEEKKNKEGETTALVQVQQPKLVTTVLDLETSTYRTLNSAGLAELLEDYGDSLMGVMREQCPVLYDPLKHSGEPLAPVARNLYTAQAHAARALVKLLTGPERAAILLGEIGSGKTGTALTAAKTVLSNRAGKVIVLCPPHLLQSWRNEASAVVPEATVTVLETVFDVDALAKGNSGFHIAVLSRETAKLGHGWIAVTGMCPGCGAALPEGDLAKKRARCPAKPRRPTDALAGVMIDLALRLAPHAPGNDRVAALVTGRHLSRCLAAWKLAPAREWTGLSTEFVARAVAEIVPRIATSDFPEQLPRALGALLAGQPDAMLEVVVRELAKPAADHYIVREIQQAVAMLMTLARAVELNAEEGVMPADGSWYGGDSFADKIDRTRTDESGYPTRIGRIRRAGDAVTSLDGHAPGSLDAALDVLANLSGKWITPDAPCGTPLFQAVPEPRRIPLASYIAKRHPKLFGLLILDEGHEYATDGSAQERAAHRLTALGMPTILATGSIMNGYASSLFTNMWALSPDFRREFKRDEQSRFVDRFGYRKIIVSEKDAHTGKPVSFGSHTDRVERTERAAGDAPGVLPLFLFRHLLAISVTLHKTDLALDLPPCKHIRHDLVPGPEMLAEYTKLAAALKRQIIADRFKEDRAGKLFGQLSELPSYLDRATDDIFPGGRGFEIRYPESVDGGAVIAAATPMAAEHRTEKEAWMLETLRAELAESRNVMVFAWHVDVLPRLQRIIKEDLGEDAPILLADKVATGKRQAWIDSKIVKPKRRIMLANPVCIQTGLNNLVWFSSELWIENPACNPTIFRQAIGRVDRIGQKATETRIHMPVYVGTLQEQLYGLLLRKVAVAVSADGLDPESALQAAGAGEDDGFLSGLSIGKQLWEMMTTEAPVRAKTVRKRATKKAPAPPRPVLDIDRVWISRRADNDELSRLGD